jgi:alcohol dehydrogenase
MRAVVFPSPGSVDVVEVPDPVLEHPADVLLRMTAAGICGSDLRSLQITDGDATWPVGHEFVGVVEEVGPGVRSLRCGDRVAVPMYTVCSRCGECTRQRHQNCREVAVFGSSHRYARHPGGQAELVRIPFADQTAIPLPDSVTDDDGVMLSDILPTALTVLEETATAPGDTLLVVGCGPVGQLVVASAPAFGVARTIAVDLDPARLALAEALGAETVTAGDDIASQVRELTGGTGADVAVDATGNPQALGTAFDALRDRGGRLFIVNGNAGEPFPFTPQQLFARRARVVASIGNPYRWREPMLRLITSRRLAPGRLVSHHASLADAPSAYTSFARREANKVVLIP